MDFIIALPMENARDPKCFTKKITIPMWVFGRFFDKFFCIPSIAHCQLRPTLEKTSNKRLIYHQLLARMAHLPSPKRKGTWFKFWLAHGSCALLIGKEKSGETEFDGYHYTLLPKSFSNLRITWIHHFNRGKLNLINNCDTLFLIVN